MNQKFLLMTKILIRKLLAKKILMKHFLMKKHCDRVILKGNLCVQVFKGQKPYPKPQKSTENLCEP